MFKLFFGVDVKKLHFSLNKLRLVRDFTKISNTLLFLFVN